PKAPRPSIETLLHGFLPFKFIIHTHADLVQALTNNMRGDEAVEELFGDEAVVVPYQRPGFRLSRMVYAAVEAQEGARYLVLRKHGLITWGDTAREAYERTVEAITLVESYVAKQAPVKEPFAERACEPLDPADRRRVAAALAPVVRGVLSKERRVVLRFDDSPEVLAFVCSADAPRLSQVGPATPDHVLSTRVWPAFVEWRPQAGEAGLADAARKAVEAWLSKDEAYFTRNTDGKLARLEAYPRVLLVPGVGMFTAGPNGRRARIVRDIYLHTVSVIRNAERIAPYVSLTEDEAYGVDYWPLELYKLTLAPAEAEFSRRVVLITGGGGGIGRVVADRFADAGAHVVVTDVVQTAAERAAAEINERLGDRAAGFAMDVSQEASVRGGFDAAC
ncbi:MAG: SDR family NAD(P)-dependent oxidoreductase, partial [Candidatus Rokuibacteriota bacterium]